MVDRVTGAFLDDFAEIHDRDAVGDMFYHRQVMRDKEIGQVKFFLQIYQQVKDLALDRDIKCRNRLIAK